MSLETRAAASVQIVQHYHNILESKQWAYDCSILTLFPLLNVFFIIFQYNYRSNKSTKERIQEYISKNSLNITCGSPTALKNRTHTRAQISLHMLLETTGCLSSISLQLSWTFPFPTPLTDRLVQAPSSAAWFDQKDSAVHTYRRFTYRVCMEPAEIALVVNGQTF